MRVLVNVHFIVFVFLGARQIWISPCTENPSGEWTAQQGRTFQMHIDDNDLKCEILTRDHDRKSFNLFAKVFKTSDCTIKLTPIRSPNLQTHIERVVQTIKREALNPFCIVTNEHLDGILRTKQRYTTNDMAIHPAIIYRQSAMTPSWCRSVSAKATSFVIQNLADTCCRTYMGRSRS